MFEDFSRWFEATNLFPVERASVTQVTNAIARYAADDADIEFDLREVYAATVAS